MINPSEIEGHISDIIQRNIHDYAQLLTAIEMLYETYPDFPVFKYFFYRLTKLNLNEIEAHNLFDNIIKHCSLLSSKLGKKVNFYVGMVDLIVERNRIILNPVFIDVFIAEEMDKHNYKDPLTCIYNRTYLNRALKAEINRATRKKYSFSMAIFDIEKFSLINNNFGYHVGNYVLIELTERIKKTIRGEDILARYFDDRFILILPNTDIDGAKAFAEKGAFGDYARYDPRGKQDNEYIPQHRCGRVSQTREDGGRTI